MSDDARRLVVRSAPAGEIALLAGLEERCFPDPWTAADLPPIFAAEAAEAFVALDGDGSALGYALFQLLPGEVELLSIGVVPEARSRGVGGFLLASALDRLEATGRPVCHLEVRVSNAPARALYERLGFELVGQRRAYYEDGEDAVRYRRSGGG
jgi:ribosomal-protein-alanine N-acetyltransferase